MAVITTNQLLLDEAIKRAIETKGLSNAMAAEIERVLRREVLPDIAREVTKLPFNQLKAGDFRLIQLREAIRQGMGWDRVTDTAMSRLTGLSGAEAEAALVELNKALPITFQTILPAPDLLFAAVFEKPFNGKIMSEWFAKLGSDAQAQIYQDFRVGMIEGKSIPHMAKDLLEGNLGAFSTGGSAKAILNAKAVARTAANIVSTRSREAFAKANPNIIRGVRYVATLDERTTPICTSLHGNVYPIGEGPRPPQHYNCRSTITFITPSFRELGIPVDELTPIQRTKLDGVVPRIEDGEAWLKTQPRAVQDGVLGPVRAELWRQGKVSNIEGFLFDNGLEVPLEKLGAGFNRAGIPLKDTIEVKTPGGQVGHRRKPAGVS